MKAYGQLSFEFDAEDFDRFIHVQLDVLKNPQSTDFKILAAILVCEKYLDRMTKVQYVEFGIRFLKFFVKFTHINNVFGTDILRVCNKLTVNCLKEEGVI